MWEIIAEKKVKLVGKRDLKRVDTAVTGGSIHREYSQTVDIREESR